MSESDTLNESERERGNTCCWKASLGIRDRLKLMRLSRSTTLSPISIQTSAQKEKVVQKQQQVTVAGVVEGHHHHHHKPHHHHQHHQEASSAATTATILKFKRCLVTVPSSRSPSPSSGDNASIHLANSSRDVHMLDEVDEGPQSPPSVHELNLSISASVAPSPSTSKKCFEQCSRTNNANNNSGSSSNTFGSKDSGGSSSSRPSSLQTFRHGSMSAASYYSVLINNRAGSRYRKTNSAGGGGGGGRAATKGSDSSGSASSHFKFVCFLCGHEYPRESTLKNHLKVYHKIDTPDVSRRINK